MRTKRKAYELVAELRRREFSTQQIAEALCYSPQRIGQMLVELGLHKPRRYPDLLTAIASLPAELCLDVLAFRGKDFQIENESPASR